MYLGKPGLWSNKKCFPRAGFFIYYNPKIFF